MFNVCSVHCSRFRISPSRPTTSVYMEFKSTYISISGLCVLFRDFDTGASGMILAISHGSRNSAQWSSACTMYCALLSVLIMSCRKFPSSTCAKDSKELQGTSRPRGVSTVRRPLHAR